MYDPPQHLRLLQVAIGDQPEIMTQQSEPISFAVLLQELPPGTESEIIATETRERMDSVHIPAPGLTLYCPSQDCKKARYFHPKGRSDRIDIEDEDDDDGDDEGNSPSYARLFYSCEQCSSLKVFFVEVQRTGGHLRALKIGEHPPYQVRTENSFSNFLGSNRELYFHGLHCENRNLGIGAFTYYRRVVEAQKEKLFESLIKAAKKLEIDAANLEVLMRASAEPQFTKALDDAKDAIPKRLFIDGTSPFILLYRALSAGIHEGSDSECMKNAKAIRVVLTRLIALMREVSADESEVRAAMAALARP